MATPGAETSVQIRQSDVLRLPLYLLEDIFNRLEDARAIAQAQCVSKGFWDAGNSVRSLRIVVLNAYHERARDVNVGSLSSGIPARIRRVRPFRRLAEENQVPLYDGGQSSSSRGRHGERFQIKDQMVKILETKRYIVQLRIEVEPTLQAKAVPADERRRTDFWISDPRCLRLFLPRMGLVLEHLCIVDYGEQAMTRRSSILRIMSQICKHLKTLDLSNMFIDSCDCEQMPSVANLRLSSVTINGEALLHINNIMPNLQILAMRGVSGVEGGVLTFSEMKVLCLGLLTPAKDIVLDLPKLEKLQLKMQCPQKLIINASILKYVAFNLEVMEPSKVDLRSMVSLEELLYGATSFSTLSDLVDKNLNLKKIFLDIPCMALAEDGRFLGVLKDVHLMLPDFSKFHKIGALEILNIGPGLWYCMETNLDALATVEKWLSMSHLILHMIPHDLDHATSVLQMLLRPSVKFMTIHVHTSSPVKLETLQPHIEAIVLDCEQHVGVNFFSWTKSLDFSCFSFREPGGFDCDQTFSL